MFNSTCTTYTITQKEWDKVQKIYDRCKEKNRKLNEENQYLAKECTTLAIENTNLEIQTTKQDVKIFELQKELKDTKMYLDLFMKKYYDSKHTKFDTLTADDLNLD